MKTKVISKGKVIIDGLTNEKFSVENLAEKSFFNKIQKPGLYLFQIRIKKFLNYSARISTIAIKEYIEVSDINILDGRIEKVVFTSGKTRENHLSKLKTLIRKLVKKTDSLNIPGKSKVNLLEMLRHKILHSEISRSEKITCLDLCKERFNHYYEESETVLV